MREKITEEKEPHTFGLHCLIYIILVIPIHGDEFLVWTSLGLQEGDVGSDLETKCIHTSHAPHITLANDWLESQPRQKH